MKNRILHLTRNTIPYVKELHAIAGGVLGCLVMQQLDYWFENHPEGFYKFLLPSDHPAYKTGDSWTEELGMSKDEFRTAFDKIGHRYKSKSEFDKAIDKFQGKFYCSYVDRRSNLTFYFRNHEAVDAALDELLIISESKPSKSALTSAGTPHLDAKFTVKQESCFTVKRKSELTGDQGSRFTGNQENPPPLYRDYNTETTTTTNDNAVIDSGGCGNDLIFPKCMKNERIAIRHLLANCPLEMRQIALDEIEGARQAGVIKTNMVPFARGIVMAISRGTFTVGHGIKVAMQRRRKAERPVITDAQPLIMDPAALKKGRELLSWLRLTAHGLGTPLDKSHIQTTG